MTTECTCPWVDEKYWTTYGSAVEPGSTREYEPTCLVHGEAAEIIQHAREALLPNICGVCDLHLHLSAAIELAERQQAEIVRLLRELDIARQLFRRGEAKLAAAEELAMVWVDLADGWRASSWPSAPYRRGCVATMRGCAREIFAALDGKP